MDLFNFALDEFNEEDENGKSKLVYSYFGLSVYYSQVIEESFMLMLWMNELFNKPKSDKKLFIETISNIENAKKTMGVFINEIKQVYHFSDDLVKDLNSILLSRNYLVHKYFKDNIQKFYTEKGKIEMINYFCSFIDNVKRIDKELEVYYIKYLNRMGLNEEKINELLQEFKIEAEILYK